MTITSTELKNDLSKYLSLAEKEEVYVSKNGRIIAKISSPYEDKIALIDSLVGIIPNGAKIEEGKEARINRHEIFD